MKFLFFFALPVCACIQIISSEFTHPLALHYMRQSFQRMLLADVVITPSHKFTLRPSVKVVVFPQEEHSDIYRSFIHKCLKKYLLKNQSVALFFGQSAYRATYEHSKIVALDRNRITDQGFFLDALVHAHAVELPRVPSKRMKRSEKEFCFVESERFLRVVDDRSPLIIEKGRGFAILSNTFGLFDTNARMNDYLLKMLLDELPRQIFPNAFFRKSFLHKYTIRFGCMRQRNWRSFLRHVRK